LENLIDVTQNAVVRQGWIVNGQEQEVWIHRKGYSVIKDSYLALEAGAILVGSFSHLETVKSTVCIRL